MERGSLIFYVTCAASLPATLAFETRWRERVEGGFGKSFGWFSFRSRWLMPYRFCLAWWRAMVTNLGDGRRTVVARRSQHLRPSWVIFHPFPRGSCNRPHKWFVQLLPPSPNAPTLTLAWFGCPFPRRSRGVGAAPVHWRPRDGGRAEFSPYPHTVRLTPDVSSRFRRVCEQVLNQFAHPANPSGYVEILEPPLLKRKDGVITRTTNRNALQKTVWRNWLSACSVSAQGGSVAFRGKMSFSVVCF